MLLPIVHFNEPVLRKKGARVEAFDSTLRELASDMVETMHEAQGIGLAAQQVGRALQMCVVDLRPVESPFDWEFDGGRPPLELFMPLALVNPEIEMLPGKETTYEEGCLSFPEIRGDVTRPDEIVARFQDLDGLPHSLRCNGLLSRCIQHEWDHLNGILFIERMPKAVVQSIEGELKALKKRTRESAAARE